MKIKLSQLRSIIREEVSRAVNESRPQVTRGRCRGCGDLDAQVVGGYCYDCHADREAREAESLATTIFECRLCGDTIQGEASPEGPEKAGWSSLAGINGPNSVCPECAKRVRQDPSELDDFRDEYPNVRLS